MRFDRDKFFSGFRQHFDDSLSQFQVDGINFLLDSFETDGAWKHIPHIAYALGTIYHETAGTMQPITERGPKSYFDKYNAGTRIGKRLGNTETGDGYKFRGRGYVQLTGRANYTREGIENSPEKALHPPTAFDIMTGGMFKGRYTGKKLSDYISDTGKDYKEARRIINGTDQAAKIANYANQFEAILRASKTNSATVSQSSTSQEKGSNPQPANQAVADITETKTTEIAQTEGMTTAVETTAPAGDPPHVPPVQVSQNGPLARWIVGGGGLSAIGTMVWGFIQGNLNAIAIAVICATLLIVVLIFRGAITDAIRMQTAADPNKKNVS